ILNASIKAMHHAISQLTFEPEFIIVDGNRFKPYKQIPYETIVKGDAKYLSIAAASILAKTHRDEYMLKLHEEFPMYGWDTNMGYPTKKHREAILEYGPCRYHRKSFRLLPEQLQLDL
ncbi:MAG: ribonuclease HII, partial [Myroides sp.]|nr:ribonuclease HII [Myroides sp.]